VLENRENIILKNTPLAPLKGGISDCHLENNTDPSFREHRIVPLRIT
jgi:hypothetical protein|tara:strand:- start:12644 stop:12784 length:141 start_codon:yes stop_codon:yes gene_type:complete